MPMLIQLTKFIGGWALLAALGAANGALREMFLVRRIGRLALPLSGLTLSLAILAATLLLHPARTQAGAWAVGLGWTAMTVAFEFAFGRRQGKTWPELLQAYTFRDGNLWPLVLLTVLLSPAFALHTP